MEAMSAAFDLISNLKWRPITIAPPEVLPHINPSADPVEGIREISAKPIRQSFLKLRIVNERRWIELVAALNSRRQRATGLFSALQSSASIGCQRHCTENDNTDAETAQQSRRGGTGCSGYLFHCRSLALISKAYLTLPSCALSVRGTSLRFLMSFARRVEVGALPYDAESRR